MTSSIFFREVHGSFHISVFVPSHEDPIFVERKSLEFSLFIDLNWCFSTFERASDRFSLFGNWDDSPIESDEVFVGISQEIFIFIDLEERAILSIDMTVFVTLVVLHDQWFFRELEICWRSEHLILEPRDDRRFIIVDIGEVIERREFITGEIAHSLKYSHQAKSIREIPEWREDKPEWILDHLWVSETVVVLVGKYRGSSDEVLESTTS